MKSYYILYSVHLETEEIEKIPENSKESDLYSFDINIDDAKAHGQA